MIKYRSWGLNATLCSSSSTSAKIVIVFLKMEGVVYISLLFLLTSISKTVNSWKKNGNKLKILTYSHYITKRNSCHNSETVNDINKKHTLTKCC